MTWTPKQIATDWLNGQTVALSVDALTEAFNRAERLLGSEWVESHRRSNGSFSSGIAPTLTVATMGSHLALIENVESRDSLIRRLKRQDRSAYAELNAIAIARSGQRRSVLIIAPPVQVERRTTRPDFSISVPDAEPVIVEVTLPDESREVRAIHRRITELHELLPRYARSCAIELCLRRCPHDRDVAVITAALDGALPTGGAVRHQLPDGLGLLLVDQTAPGVCVLQDHEGEPVSPRIGGLHVLLGPDGLHRHMLVRIAFDDDRADQLLRREARHLPEGGTSCVVFHTRGGRSDERWAATLARRFGTGFHTRVSAACLVSGGFETTPNGEAWVGRARLVPNPRAARPLPRWFCDQLAKFPPHVRGE